MSEQRSSVFVHILTYGSARFIERCLESVLSQDEFVAGENLHVALTDNASSDGIEAIAAQFSKVKFRKNTANLGFCGGHNQGVRDFLDGRCEYFLILNPDVRLEPRALIRMVEAARRSAEIGMVTPLLLRADQNLNPITPAVVDAAGMKLLASLRHLDRGSGEALGEQYREAGDVFGGTGACLLISRRCVEDLLLNGEDEDALYVLYPQLRGAAQRAPLFDEAFFAYREDADLSWRAQLLGWRCYYTPEAIGFHQRVVLPERRPALPAELNLMSVRNRFLMQINNFSLPLGFRSVFEGLVVRNFAVVLGVLITERSSVDALRHVWRLRRRALSRRRTLFSRVAQRREARARPISRLTRNELWT